MGFWDGMFFKHRDYLHRTFFEHARANGADFRASDEPFEARRDPATMQPLDSRKLLYLIRLILASGAIYDYFVGEGEDGSQPTIEEIAKEIQRQASTILPEGVERLIEDFLTEEAYQDYLDLIETWKREV